MTDLNPKHFPSFAIGLIKLPFHSLVRPTLDYQVGKPRIRELLFGQITALYSD